METVNIYELKELLLPVDKYNFIVRTLTSVDGGNNFYYCGNSRYFETKADAEEYKRKKEQKGGLLNEATRDQTTIY